MDRQIKKGQSVTLNSALGEVERVVVEVLGDVLLVCRKEEYRTARREGRKPASIGFRRSDLVEKTP